MADHGKELGHRQRLRNLFKRNKSEAADGVGEPSKGVPKAPSVPVVQAQPPPSGSAPQQAQVDSTPSHQPELKRNLSKEAFDKLSAETQDEIRKLLPNVGLEANDFSSSARDELKALVDIVQTKETECEKKFWKINIAGNDIVVKDYVKSTLGVLQGIGDIAINFAPAPGSIVWSGVKTMMQMYVDSDAELCALLMVTQSVTPVLCRVQSYEAVFTVSNNTKPADLESLNNAAIDVYGTCFKIMAYTSGELGSKMRRAKHALLGSTALNDMMASLNQLQSEHERCVNLCRDSSTSESLQQVRDGLGLLAAALEQNERMLKKVGAGVDLLVSEANLDILDWISPVRYKNDHDTVSERRAPGTTTWLVEHASFKAWETSSSGLFWLEGTVGVGKSVLSSSVIDHFLKSFRTSPEDAGFAYFYCNRGSTDHRDSLSIAQSYVRQLSTTLRSQSEIRDELRVAYHKERGQGGKGLNMQTCEKHMLDSANLYPQTVIVLDGLDECEKRDRKILFKILDKILALPNAKVFLASRPTEDLRGHFDWTKHFRFDASDNAKDVEIYVDQMIEENDDWNDEDVPLETKDLIKKTLLDQKEGQRPMFRWVSLQLGQLFECRSTPDIMDRLGKLPPDLDKSYNEIYERNTGKVGPDGKAHVVRLFQWALAAVEKPTSDLLIQAIRFSTDGAEGSGITKSTMLDLCQHLLVVDPKTDRWQFTHASVADWFESHHYTLAQAQCHVAKVCLSLLLKLDSSPSVKRPSVLEEESTDNYQKPLLPWQFQAHIHRYWPEYVRTLNDDKSYDSDLVALLKKFLNSPMESSEQYQRWVSWIWPACEANEWPYPFYTDVGFLRPPKIALLSMVAYGFTTILQEWWDTAEMKVSMRCAYGTNLLVFAISAEVLKLLLKRGIDVNMPVEEHGSALGLLILSDDLDLVKQLVEYGAQVNIDYWDCEHCTPLHAAVRSSTLEMVKYLVEQGADVNRPLQDTRMSGSVLGEAAQQGKLDLVEYLVNEAKADVNMKLVHGHFENALEAAQYGLDVSSEEEHEKHREVIQFLKDAGAMPRDEEAVTDVAGSEE